MRRGLLVLALAIWGSCSDKDSGATGDASAADARTDADGPLEVEPQMPTRLCDGRPGLVFSFVRVANLGRLGGPGTVVAWENGAAFLHVTGDCTYWAFTGSRLGGPS